MVLLDPAGKVRLTEVGVILPAYNEADRIEEAVRRVERALMEMTPSYQITIAEDGSSDGTDRIGQQLAERSERVVHLHGETRLGRGKSLATAIRKTECQVIVYMDVDLATDLRYLQPLVEAVKEGYHVTTGSRLLAGSRVKRTFMREVASRSYNLLVRILLGSKVRDHQCGFKAFHRASIMTLLDQVKAEHWFWDTEMLVKAQRAALRVKEIPVDWKSSGTSKVGIVTDSARMGWEVLRLWWSLR